MYSGGSGLSIDIHFVNIELSYDVLSHLPIVLSKHFNHPHPYIEIATAISDKLLHMQTLYDSASVSNTPPFTTTNYCIINLVSLSTIHSMPDKINWRDLLTPVQVLES